MKNKIWQLGIFLALIISIDPAYGYKFRVTNITGDEIAILINGVVVGSMMQGIYNKDGPLPTQKFSESDMGNTKTIKNAGHLDGAYKIPHNHTVEFVFSNWDIGVCFDLSNIEVGLESNGFNMVNAEVVALPNHWYDTVFNAVSASGGSVEEIGQALHEKIGAAITNVSTAVPEPRVQAVIGAAGLATEGAGMFTEAMGKLVGTFGSLIRASTCKDMAFIAVRTAENHYVVTLLTQQQ